MYNSDDIDIVELRPRFRLKTSLSKKDVKLLFENNLRQTPRISGKIVGDHLHLTIQKKDLHFWSPELGVDFDFRPQLNLIRCLIGPKQQVWAMFMFLYGAITIGGMFGSIYGFTRWQLDQGSDWLWTFPIAIILLAVVFITAKIGQQIGHDQMVLLIKFVHKTLGKENFVEH